eukprot:scaffold144578_cov30-Tisochrysis_lutea.AAC.3
MGRVIANDSRGLGTQPEWACPLAGKGAALLNHRRASHSSNVGGRSGARALCCMPQGPTAHNVLVVHTHQGIGWRAAPTPQPPKLNAPTAKAEQRMLVIGSSTWGPPSTCDGVGRPK